MISGLSFQYTPVLGATPAVTNDAADSGELIDASWSSTPVVDPSDTINNWPNISSIAGTVDISAIGHGPPADLIIGNPASNGTYSGQNSSITNCHACPYVLGYATFNIAITGVISSTEINKSTTVMNFGTATTETLTLNFRTPEPGSAFLFGVGLVWIAWRKLRGRSTRDKARVLGADQSEWCDPA